MILRMCIAESIHILSIDSKAGDKGRVLFEEGVSGLRRGFTRENRTGRTVKITH